MEITKTLSVSKEEFHHLILDMLVADIKESTGKDVPVSEIISGYTYKKELSTKLGKQAKVKTKLVEIVPGCYKAEFTSVSGINSMCYEYSETGECEISVLYKEDYEASSKANDLNFKAMNFLFTRRTKKRINMMLDSMERFIIENRSKKED